MSDFLTEEEIYEELKIIAESKGWYSESIDIFCEVMAHAIYLKNFMTLSLMRESSLLTATKIDSIINLAHNNFYSIPRGNCQKLLIKDVFPLKAFEAKKFDLIATIGSHSIYYAKDSKYIIQTIPTSIETIIGSSMYEQTFNSSDMYFDILETDLSEDIYFLKNGEEIIRYDSLSDFDYENKEDLGLVYTTEPKDWTPATRPYLIMTIPGYGVRIYNCEPFNVLDTYTFKCIKLSPQETGDKSTSDIRKLPGFTTQGNTLSSFENTDTVYPETNSQILVSNTIANYVSSGKLVSYNDIENFVRLDFPDFLGYYVSYIKASSSGSQDQIFVYYLLPDDALVDESRVLSFEKRLRGYNVPDLIKFEKVITKSVNLDLIVVLEADVAQSSIDSVINDYQNRVGVQYYIDDLKADICRIDGVAFCETYMGEGTYMRYDVMDGTTLVNDYRAKVEPNQRVVFGSGEGQYRVITKTLNSVLSVSE